MTVSDSYLHLVYNLLSLLPQPLSIMLWREKPFWKCSSSLLLVVYRCPQSSQSHLRHILTRGSICTWGCSSSCCNHTKNHKEKQLELLTQPLQFPGLPLQQLHYKGNHSPSAMLTPPDTGTSRLTSGLHSIGGKKTILPPLLLLLRLLFLSACSSTHRQQPWELCTTGTSLRSQSWSATAEDEREKKSENKMSGWASALSPALSEHEIAALKRQQLPASCSRPRTNW